MPWRDLSGYFSVEVLNWAESIYQNYAWNSNEDGENSTAKWWNNFLSTLNYLPQAVFYNFH